MKRITYIILTVCGFLFLPKNGYSQKWIPIKNTSENKAVTKEVIESSASAYTVRVHINGLHEKTLTNNFGDFHCLSLGTGGLLMESGKPSLPVFSQLIAIPSGKKVSVSVDETRWTDIDIGKIYPAQMPDRNSVKQSFLIDNISYAQPFIPSIVTMGEEQTWRGIRNVGVNVCPFKYYPNEGRLSVLSDFLLQVKFTEQEQRRPSSTSWQEVTDNAWLFDNKVYDYSGCEQTRDSNEDYDYLIIVNNSSIQNSDELKKFRWWKAMKGHATRVKSYSSIGGTLAELEDSIHAEYNKGVRYVLFIGDENSIPLHGISSLYYQSKYIKSDYLYGCLDFSNNWEAEMVIGRFSVSNFSDFENMVNKTIRYENSCPTYNKALLVAHRDEAGDPYWGYQDYSEAIRSVFSQSMSFDTAYGANEGDGGDDATNSYVVGKINQGIPIINYLGYGYANYWGGIEGWSSYGWNASNELFYSSEVSNMINTPSSVFFSIAPNTGNIEATNNMLESFTRSPYGAVAFIGSTMNGNVLPNYNYNYRLFDKLLNNHIYEIGNLNLAAHVANVQNYNNSTLYKDNALSYICGGDPTLEIWTAIPQTFGNVDLTVNGSSITCSTQCNDDYWMHISTEDFNTVTTYHWTNNTCTFPKPNGNFYLSFNTHNYIPYPIYYNTTSDLIQNKTFFHDAYYEKTPMSIGESVTLDISEGEVVVKDGSKLVIQNGTGGVMIESGFECELGGIFEVR